MKKALLIIMALAAITVFDNSTVFAKNHKGQEYITVTAYYCTPGPGYCLTFRSGNMGVTIPGIINTTTIRVPKPGETISEPAQGYEQVESYFIHDAKDNNKGKGIKNGVANVSQNEKKFDAYDVKGQLEYHDFDTWQDAVK